jgi:orotidine-5'-phosphate decarboxylase
MKHFADRLASACKSKGNSLCVGLDPRWEQLPLEVRARHRDGTLDGVGRAFAEFCLNVLDLVAPLVPVVKPQSAFFEACGPAGMLALQRVLERARTLGLMVIVDSKRNDIAATATAYAEAVLGGVSVDGTRFPVWPGDAMTVNPYLGRDAIEPFLKCARRDQGGVFVLVRTSNPGAGLFQDLRVDCSLSKLPASTAPPLSKLPGSTAETSKLAALTTTTMPLYQVVGEIVAGWADENLGECGFGDVGAVVGATHPTELAELRRLLPRVPFLVPGYGAQGGSAAGTAAAFRADGLGAIVNSSRGITASFAPEAKDWPAAVVAATTAAVRELRSATPMGNLAH